MNRQQNRRVIAIAVAAIAVAGVAAACVVAGGVGLHGIAGVVVGAVTGAVGSFGVFLPLKVMRWRMGRSKVAVAAGWLAGLAGRLLPAGDRARYAEEWRAELWDLAHAGVPRRGQVTYALRLTVSAWWVRSALRRARPRKEAA